VKRSSRTSDPRRWGQALRLEFDLQARIGLDYFYDFVVARHEVSEGDFASLRGESVDLVKVECDELFDLEDIDAICQAQIFCQSFSDGQTSETSDQYWTVAGIQVLAAALDDCFTGRRDDVDCDVPNEEVAFGSRLLT
jgi:hypothetical protein